MRNLFVFFALFLVVFSNRTFSQDIYTYDNSTVGAPIYVDPLIGVSTSLTAIGTGVTTPCTFGFSGITGFTGLVYTTAGPCIQVTLTASAGYTITSTGFTAGLRRSTTGPDKVRLAYSTDGLSWIDDGVDHVPTNAACATSTAGTTLASWTTFSITNTTLYFRLYPYNASGSGGTIQIYGLDIIGNVHLICTTPTIAVTPPGGSICSGGAGIALTGSGAGVGGTYTWLPSTGLSATTGATVTANPTVMTTYTVTGTVVGGCNNTAAATVTVNPLPPTTVTASGPLSFCPGGSVTLTAPAGYTYQWRTAGTPIPGATNISFTATASGNYSVRVTNGFGCSAASAVSVVFVSTFPVISVSPATASICNGSSIVLTALGAGVGGTYSWGPAAGLSGTFGAVVTASATITTTYTVTGTNAIGCSGVTTRTVTVNVAPPAAITAVGATTFCTGGSVILTTPSGYFYQWYNGATAIPGAISSIYTATLPGNYTVVVTGLGCSRTSAVTVVNTLPLPNTTITASGPVAFCSPGSVTLSVPPVGGTTYQWYKGAGGGTLIVGATNSLYTASTTSYYHVYAVGANGCYNVSVGTRVTEVTTPYIVSPTGSKICAGGSAALSIYASGLTSGVTYQWKLNGTSIAVPQTAYFIRLFQGFIPAMWV
jgi:Ig-like domain CHU_C associated